MRFKLHPFFSIKHIIPLIIMFGFAPLIFVCDLFAEIYHHICFPLYGIKCISRKKYIRIDRHRLSYLNWYEKIFCVYCGYVNGLIAYWQAGLAINEAYWCGIRHKHVKSFIPPKHHKAFLPYGNEKAFKNFLKKRK